MAYDIKKYMEQLGNVAADQKEIIKQYLEKQCEQDEALKAVYNPDKIDECYDFITNCARQIATGSKACLEDAVVFKMARDFFLGDVPQKKEKKKETDKTDAMPEDKAEGGTEAEDSEEDVVQVESCAIPEDVARDMKEDAAKEPAEEKLEVNKLEQLEKQFAEIKQALSEGKTIQIKQNGEWVDWENPCHFEGDKEYRIKPVDEVKYDENGNGMLFEF